MEEGKPKHYQRLEKESKIKFSDIVGGVPEEIQDMYSIVKQCTSFRKIRAKTPNGFLFVGPPGTGKTHLARAIAGELGIPFFAVNGSEFLSKWVGVGPKSVRDLFCQAREAAVTTDLRTSIVFIDEIDAIGRRSDLDLSRTSTILSALLSEMDGFERFEDRSVIVIGATNEPGLLDKALKRVGRFDKLISISLPDEKKREALLRHFILSHPHDAAFGRKDALDVAVRGTQGWNVADLQKLVNDAAVLAAKDESEELSVKHLFTALSKSGGTK